MARKHKDTEGRLERGPSAVIKLIIAILIAVYVLFPFYLVVINSRSEPAGRDDKHALRILERVRNLRDHYGCFAVSSGAVRRNGCMGDLPQQQDQMGDRDLLRVHRVHDHSVPGGYASADRDLP